MSIRQSRTGPSDCIVPSDRPSRRHVADVMAKTPLVKGAPVWVFGYGSLMWNPGFPHLSREPALVHGWHRAFCVYSHVWRGTPEKPGLVLGLDRGGSCRGIAFKVAPAKEKQVLDYLDERERVTNVYWRRRLAMTLPSGHKVEAWGYIAERSHPQYAGKLTTTKAARLIVAGEGKGGTNIDYLENTITHLDGMSIPEGPLHRLRDTVRKLAVKTLGARKLGS